MEITVIYAYEDRISCILKHAITLSGKSYLISRNRYISSCTSITEQYEIPYDHKMKLADTGTLKNTVYRVGDIEILVFDAHQDTDLVKTIQIRMHKLVQDPNTGNLVPSGYKIAVLDYDTYKDVDFTNFNEIMSHPTLEVDMAFQDANDTYSLYLDDLLRKVENNRMERLGFQPVIG